ncbi:lycopene epsilon cyclase, chloroplastic-like [Gossypium australe]|uniref:Lycopene epsilon cyclase, chloroplastic-like n=1 Tax=Gossypium australe TaxID=47621 RepID=A0A5B6UKY6_9ROSI|nr:lycopene epsilon cyclase, chloroplastic-like [Gossypium australe]
MMITTSVGARNFAAVAVSKSATWRSRRRKDPVTTKMAVSNNQRLISLEVSGSGAARESYVAVKEGFAYEEDYVKAGGSELLFVQMQQHKEMDEQSKLADKLPPISIGDNILDLVVIGSGPAGLALAAESAKLGLIVGLISPDLPFTNNYGLWEDEIKGLPSWTRKVYGACLAKYNSIPDKPITIRRAYGRVERRLLREELLKRCVESGVMYLSSKVESIVEATGGHNLVACEYEHVVPCRLVVVASGAASGKFLQYEVGGPRVAMQSAYGIEVELQIHELPKCYIQHDGIHGYRDYAKEPVPCLEDQYPSFLYGMPMSSTRETCLALKEAVPMDFLKKKLMSRLRGMGIRIVKVYEEEWSYVPLGGSLPNMKQKNLAFGAAASMVDPATGYSIARSLSEAPNYASVIAKILKKDYSKGFLTFKRNNWNMSIEAWNTLWPQERKRQRSFFLLGLALLLQLDTEGSRTFFRIFFRLPSWMRQGFLGSTLSSIDLVVFTFSMFVIAPMDMKMLLIRHLLKDPTATTMISTYLTI